MVGIYLSGTGNTRRCTQRLVHLLDEQAQTVPIEEDRAVAAIKENGIIVLAYPVQFSNAPVMVRDFIKNHADLWQDKKVLCVATMGAFSGDGTGCTARLLKKYGAKIIGGLHIRMPDSVCDVKLLKKPLEKNKQIVLAADKKTEALPPVSRLASTQKKAWGSSITLPGYSDSGFGFMAKRYIILTSSKSAPLA